MDTPSTVTPPDAPAPTVTGRTIRIFISSPGDVAEERERARQVVEQLRRRYAGAFDVKAVLWEDLPLQADMSFQQGIDMVLSRDRGIDIAVFILWSRLGSPVGGLIPKADGTEYRSGTEREFDLMQAARRDNKRRNPDSDAPKILVYTRKDEASFDERLRGRATDEKNRLITQKKLVELFMKEEFHDATSGTNVRAYHSFDQPATFSQRLRVHLQEILDGLAGGGVQTPVWDVAARGSPFRGLESFEYEHGAVFFGREDEVLEVRRALQRKAREGCAFVLISGASGSGKSSLARAGVVPAIVEHEVDSTVARWRHAVFTPSQAEGDLCGGLARLLCSDSVLPELRVSEDSVRALAEGFAAAPKPTVDQSVRPALERASQGKPGATRLLLLLDPMEELFTDRRLSDADRERFLSALEALARSGAVWVLATVRSDFYQHGQSVPALMRMKEGPGQVDLLPPTADALRRLIEYPARLAGLTFEQRGGTSLADRILIDATAHAELLPLLSYLLRELFEQRSAAGVLSFASYERLGGVEGALAKRAEDVFGALPAEAQEQLPAVLRALVSVSGDEEESVVRQRVAFSTFPSESASRVLVDRFVAERFLVAERHADGTGSVTVAHEALLRVWSRAARWIAENREFLRVRARVAARIKEGSRLLDGDTLLDTARHHLAAQPEGFTAEQRAFIEECARSVDRSRRRRERLRLQIIAVLAVLLAAALLAAGWALRQQHRVIEHAARMNLLYAGEMAEKDQADVALAYLAEALRTRPDDASARLRLASLLRQRRWPLLLDAFPPDRGGHPAALDPDARQAAVLDAGALRAWTANSNRVTVAARDQEPEAYALAVSADGAYAVTADAAGTASVWQVSAGTGAVAQLVHAEPILAAAFSANNQWIVTVGREQVRLWNLSTGAQAYEGIHGCTWRPFAAFSPDGTWLLAPRGDKVLAYEPCLRRTMWEFDLDGGQAGLAAFSPNGQFVAVVRQDAHAGERLILLKCGTTATAAWTRDGPARHVAFSPDGRFVATASGYLADRKGFVEILDARTGAPTGPSLTLGNDVHAVAFDAAGERLLVASDESALLYEVASRRRLAEPLRHSAGVEDVAFSRNGLRIVTRTENDGCFLWENPLPRPLARPHSRPSPDPTQALQRVASDAARACRDATVTCREYSPDGCLLAAGLDNGSVWLIPADGASAPRGPLEQSGEVIGLRFSADGTRLAVRSGDKYGQGADVAVTVWDCTARRKVFGPYRDPEGISSACPSPDGSRILLGLRDGRARLCTLNNGQSIVSPRLLTGRIVATAFDPRGRIAAVADENRVRFCDARTGAPSAASLWHPDRIYCLEFSPNGRFLATGSADNAARVWDTRTGSLRAGPLPHAVAVFSVAFSRDGRWLLTAAAAALRVWSVDAGLPLTDPIEAAADAGGTPAAAPEVISRARFQSDNLRLAASSRQRLWTGEAISPADRLADAEHLRRVCECLSGIVMDAASGRPARLGERERLRLRQVSATSPPAAGPFDDLLYWASGVGEAPDGATTNGPFVVCP